MSRASWRIAIACFACAAAALAVSAIAAGRAARVEQGEVREAIAGRTGLPIEEVERRAQGPFATRTRELLEGVATDLRRDRRPEMRRAFALSLATAGVAAAGCGWYLGRREEKERAATVIA